MDKSKKYSNKAWEQAQNNALFIFRNLVDPALYVQQDTNEVCLFNNQGDSSEDMPNADLIMRLIGDMFSRAISDQLVDEDGNWKFDGRVDKAA